MVFTKPFYRLPKIKPWTGFWPEIENFDFGKKNTIGKGISRGAEWRKFQLHSTFHFGVNGPQRMTSISAKTPYYSPWFSGQNLKILTLAKKDSIEKGISRGAEWRKFQLHSTFHFGVNGPQRMTSISAKTPYYSPWFLAKIWKF